MISKIRDVNAYDRFVGSCTCSKFSICEKEEEQSRYPVRSEIARLFFFEEGVGLRPKVRSFCSRVKIAADQVSRTGQFARSRLPKRILLFLF